MKEENRKEILTREIIKKELKEIYIHNLLLRFWWIPFCLFGTWSIGWLISYHSSLKDGYANTGIILLVIQFSVAIIAYIALLSATVYIVYKFLSLIVSVCNNKFDIVIDKLVDKEKDGRHKYNLTEYSIDEMELPDHRKPYVFLFPDFAIHNTKKAYVIHKLRFSKHKWFYIPEGKLYRWSDKYRMEH